MLTQTLRTLERDGLVDRTVTASVPVRVDYTLTALGESLSVQRAIKSWAETHVAQVHAARARYDGVPEPAAPTDPRPEDPAPMA